MKYQQTKFKLKNMLQITLIGLGLPFIDTSPLKSNWNVGSIEFEFFKFSYANSETFILPLMPVVSHLLVKLTVSPNKQYLGIRLPITPVTISPLLIPIVILLFKRKKWIYYVKLKF